MLKARQMWKGRRPVTTLLAVYICLQLVMSTSKTEPYGAISRIFTLVMLPARERSQRPPFTQSISASILVPRLDFKEVLQQPPSSMRQKRGTETQDLLGRTAAPCAPKQFSPRKKCSQLILSWKTHTHIYRYLCARQNLGPRVRTISKNTSLQ